MKDFIELLKQGNKSSFTATIVNAIIAIVKGVAFTFTGNVAMFAEMMHSIGDAANQLFVFIGSALSRKPATKRFPNGFGRVINLVCLGAVIVVGILAYETVKEGWNHIFHPTESTKLWITLTVLGISTLLEFSVLVKASNEILHDVGEKSKGVLAVFKSYAYLKRAKPATKLVYLEDSVATTGGLLAFIAVLISHYTAFSQAEGIASIIIGLMMFYIVSVIFLENARGALGEVDEHIETQLAHVILNDPDVKDIYQLAAIKEGEFVHVEVEVEISPKLSFAEVDDIQDRLVDKILEHPQVEDVSITFDEDDGVKTWKQKSKKENPQNT